MRILEHPLHPALVHFPIAFWCTATLHDAGVITGIVGAGSFSWYCLILGSTVALPVMATGWYEYSKLPATLHGLASRHMSLMTLAWVAYVVALILRTQHATLITPTWVSYTCSVMGLLFVLAGAWHGGELVYAHGAGVMPSASADTIRSTTINSRHVSTIASKE